MPPRVYHLPHTLRNWPWKPSINQYYNDVEAECALWIQNFPRLSPATRGAAFSKTAGSLLAAMTYPEATSFHLRSCCELMYTFYTVDEFTDRLDGAGAKVLCDATIDAIENPDKPRLEGEPIVGEIARQFWQRASISASKASRERFIKTWRSYVTSVVQQAERRSTSYICTLDEYMIARRDNIGTDPSFVFVEISLGLDLPHEVMEHPAIVSLGRDATDMLIIGNDLVSYKKEVLANSADYNILTIIMVNNQTDLVGAVQWVSDRHDELVEHFLAAKDDILNHRNGVPSWGEAIDLQVERYIHGLGLWICGHDEWGFHSRRYFGDEGLEIQKSRIVVLP
ncbi:terpenoid synthase [Mycena leptocephala]|nr:terpenoid synthase [Mycena leptocephala]